MNITELQQFYDNHFYDLYFCPMNNYTPRRAADAGK